MPILELSIVGDLPVDRREGLAQRVADVAGTLFGVPHGTTWVRVSEVPADSYAENGGAAPDPLPVFVSILRAQPPEGLALEQEAARFAAALSLELGRPIERIHLIYELAGRGRVAFGGKLKT